MVTFALITVISVVAVAVVVRLVSVVRHDRSPGTPRSHTHELDPQSVRLHHVV
jgi:hypothetical protein